MTFPAALVAEPALPWFQEMFGSCRLREQRRLPAAEPDAACGRCTLGSWPLNAAADVSRSCPADLRRSEPSVVPLGDFLGAAAAAGLGPLILQVWPGSEPALSLSTVCKGRLLRPGQGAKGARSLSEIHCSPTGRGGRPRVTPPNSAVRAPCAPHVRVSWGDWVELGRFFFA